MGRMASIFWRTAAHAIGMMLAGWIHREQEAVVVYQKEEIRALREMRGERRLRFTDAQRRRLALKARPLSHATLRELGSLVAPDTLTRWFRKYAGAKYDGHAKQAMRRSVTFDTRRPARATMPTASRCRRPTRAGRWRSPTTETS